jgi:hypothetical protein
MTPLAALTLLALSLSAAPTCPDGGETLFLKVDRGFQGYRLIGDGSYRSFFAGRTFERGSSAKPVAGREEFWVDELLAQWMLVAREAFLKADPKDAGALLEAFYRFQAGTLADAGTTGAGALGATKGFDALNEKGADGRARPFKIWKAALGAEATQFWVATPAADGVVVLSVIATSRELVPKAQALIDSYMFNFGPIDAAGCRRLREQAGKRK